jgi:PAS domain S-box-containing protein
MSLRLRLALIYGLLASLALTLALVIGFGFYERAAFRNIDGVLSLLTQQAATELVRENRLEPPPLGIRTTLRLFTPQGHLLETAGNEAAPVLDPFAEGVPAHARWVSLLPRVSSTPVSYQGLGLLEIEGERWRSFALTLEDDRILQLLIPLNNTDRALNNVRRNFFLLGLSAVALVLVLGYALSGASLRPLTELASNTRELLHAQNIMLPAVIEGKERQSVESRKRIPSQDELSFLSRTITSTTTFLSEERERLDLALESAKMGWWEWDVSANIHRWSPEFERVLGLEPGTFKGGPEAFLERVHPEDRDLVRGLTSTTKADLRPLVFEYRVRTKNGLRWIESRAQIIRDSSGHISRILGIDLDITERKSSQEELRYAANILANVSEAIIATDLAGAIHSWNTGASEIYGYSPSEVKGKNIAEVLETTFFGDTLEQSREHLTKRGLWRGEVVQRHKDGTPLDISASVRLQYDEAGRPFGMVAANRDISQRKQAERELRESEERFRAVQQTTPDGFMLFESVRDSSGTITDFRWVYANPATRSLVGREPETLLGKLLLVEMPGNRTEGLFDAYVHVVETGQTWQREFSYPHEGIDKWFRSTAAKTGDGFAVSFADISESKQLEHDLRSNEERYRSLVQASAQLVWSTNADGFNAEPQDSWLSFTGQRWEDEQGWGWLNAVHEGDRERVRASWTHAIKTKTTYTERERLRRRDGVYRYMDVRAVPVFNADGTVREWVGTHTDVTERVQATEALSESEERYRTLVMASNQAVFTADEAGHVAGAEAVWHSLSGQVTEVAKGDGWLAAVHPDDRAHVEQAWRRAMQERSAYEFQYQTNARGNARRHLSVKAVPRFSAQGNFLEWIGAITDITERRRLELDNEFLSQVSELLRNAENAETLLPTISQKICAYLELPDCFFK